MSFLSVSGLTLKLGDNTVLNNISLNLPANELIGLIGPNGAGKTSLLKCILGLFKTSGEKILLDGEDLRTMDLAHKARQVAYLAQGQVAHWPLSVERIVALGRFPHLAHWQSPGKEDQKIINDSMYTADVYHLREKNISKLSGGERTRALLARALAVKARLFLADEPIAALDPAHALSVMQLLRNTCQHGSSVIVVMHDLTLAARFCHRLVLLHQGSVIQTGSAKEVLTDENLRAVYQIKAYNGEDGNSLFVPWSLCSNKTKNNI